MFKITKEKVNEIINSLESMQSEHPFSHGQAEVTEYIPQITEILKKHIPQKPYKESSADRCCLVCDAYINFDVINDDLKQAPNYCVHCGNALDWSDEDE